MPFYSWFGITIDGNECKGKLFALSDEQLEGRLFEQGIALISCTKKKPLFYRAITPATMALFFQELSVLLKASILLPDALMMLGSQFPQYALQNILQTLASNVTQGIPLHEAMKQFPHCFTVFMIQMVHIGYEGGDLSRSVELLNDHLQTQQRFKKKIQTALVTPLCTFVFLLVTTFVIFVFIVPHFASLLQQTDKPLPFTTHCMLYVGSFLSSLAFPLIILTGFAIALMMWRWMNAKKDKSRYLSLLMRVPFFRALIREQLLAHCFNSLHVLLVGGIQLREALNCVSVSMKGTILGEHIGLLEHAVQSGYSFSHALYVSDSSIFNPEIVSMITIAQESGEIRSAMSHVARVYTHRVVSKLTILSTIVQPLTLIILGVLVSLLVFSIYIPLFSIIDTVTL